MHSNYEKGDIISQITLKINKTGKYDVVIIGGGLAGCSAAIVSARKGTCILTGQAAGTAAAMVYKLSIPPKALPEADLHSQLVKDRVYL